MVWSVTLLGVIDILFCCTPHLLTLEVMVHHHSARLYHTADVILSEPPEAAKE